MKRRNRGALEEAIARAKTSEAKAIAYYKLGLFHDNNSREADAIPHYEKALRLGLNTATKSQALAWLASSLYKTGHLKQALNRVKESRLLTSDDTLRQFLVGLERRIRRRE